MGGNKPHAISQHPLLQRYVDHFRDTLGAGDTKLMVIGYGFIDEHINQLLIDGARSKGMKMYLVNPSGLAVLDRYPP